MDKTAAYEILLSEHPLWTKEALVFGASEPDVSEAIEPLSSRTRKIEAYAKEKSVEPRTPLGTALMTGGVVGGGIGALIGTPAGVPGALAGGLVGGSLGALYGGILSETDAQEIERMKRLRKSGKYQEAAVDAGLAQIRRRREEEQMERDRYEYRRQSEHREQMRRLSGIESRMTYGRYGGSPYRY